MKITTLFYGKRTNHPTNKAEPFLIACEDQHLYLLSARNPWQEVTGTDTIPPAALPNNDAFGGPFRYTGGYLAGNMVVSNVQQCAVRYYATINDDPFQPLLYDNVSSWEALEYRATIMRPFRDFMLAGNVFLGSDFYPHRVMWSAQVGPNEPPNDWVPSPTNRAGDADLDESAGDVQEMWPLRDRMIIYKSEAIYRCTYVGGSVGVDDPFRFEKVTTNFGVRSADTVVEHNGIHFVQGNEDIFTFDGNSGQSIISGVARRNYFKDLNPDFPFSMCTIYNPDYQEIIFAYVSNNAPANYLWPDKCMVLDLASGTWWERDYNFELGHAVASDSVYRQNSTVKAGVLGKRLYAANNTNGYIALLEEVPDRGGCPTPCYLERKGLFADPGHEWIQVDNATVQISGNPAELTLGGQRATDGPVVWRSPVDHNPATMYKTDSRANDNQIAYKIRIDTAADWSMSSINLKVQKSGEAG